MPTKAATGTKHMKTTAKPVATQVDADLERGAYPRRNWTDADGKVHHEERQPPSKEWVEVAVFD